MTDQHTTIHTSSFNTNDVAFDAAFDAYVEGIDGQPAGGGAARACCVCGQELTDAASVEAGIGPVCRKRANEALARTFPSDPLAAIRLLRTAREERAFTALPAVVYPTIDALTRDVEDGAERADWRVNIKRIEWILSHQNIGFRAKEALYGVALALGYPASVALWRGDTVVGKTTVRFVAPGRIQIAGPRPNPSVRDAMKAAGMWFVPADKSWMASPRTEAAADKLSSMLRTHFLALDGHDEAFATLRAGTPSPARAAAPVTPAPRHADPVVSLHFSNDGGYILRSPYNSDFLTDLKAAIAPQRRRWMGGDRAWWISTASVALVPALVERHFQVRVEI
jgi:hypothetical protein